MVRVVFGNKSLVKDEPIRLIPQVSVSSQMFSARLIRCDVALIFSLSKDKFMAKQKQEAVSFELVNPRAAGIDVGKKEYWVAVGQAKDQYRKFGTFTKDLHELAKWLQSHEIETVAMESTGVYWKNLFLVLQSYGFKVSLVNAKHVKNMHGKKTDIKDCQWLQKLHGAGLLRSSYQPDLFTEKIRSYNRHRSSLIQDRARCINRIQKALVLMNIRLDIVLSDVVGKSGILVIEALIEGKRDPAFLVNLFDKRVKADRKDILSALEGEWRDEYLFTLRQNYEQYKHFEAQIVECDHILEKELDLHIAQASTQAEVESAATQASLTAESLPSSEKEEVEKMPSKKKVSSEQSNKGKKSKKKKHKNDLSFNVFDKMEQLTGVDFKPVPGVGPNLLLTLLSEVDVENLAEKFPSAKHFTSWLGLSPNNKISGGKLLSSKTQKNKNVLAAQFRMAASSLSRQHDTPLGSTYQRIKGKQSGSGVKATVAVARKLAVIIYNMITKKEAFRPHNSEAYEAAERQRKLKKLKKLVAELGGDITELAS